MTTALDIIKSKGRQVWTIGSDDTVFDALKAMARYDIGALIVVDDDKPIGLFTERHYARNVILKGRSSLTTCVTDVMRRGFVYVLPSQTIDECMVLVTEHRVRHLPVMEEGRLIGLLSIGDLVKSTIADREFMIEQLSNYISGSA